MYNTAASFFFYSFLFFSTFLFFLSLNNISGKNIILLIVQGTMKAQRLKCVSAPWVCRCSYLSSYLNFLCITSEKQTNTKIQASHLLSSKITIQMLITFQSHCVVDIDSIVRTRYSKEHQQFILATAIFHYIHALNAHLHSEKCRHNEYLIS